MPLRVPRPASSSPPARWRAFVRRPSGRLASTRHTSATEARRSLAASFTSFGCGSAMSAVYAFACHRPSIHHLRPSATVAAWQPGPAALVRGKASIPPGVAGVHPCPENVGNAKFSAIFFGVNRPGLPPSPIRITPLVFTNQTNCKKAATAPEASGSGRSRRLAAPPTVSPISPPTHQR